MAERVQLHSPKENQPMPWTPPGGLLKEFKEAAMDALHEAARWRVDGNEPLYNVYLTSELKLEGLTAHLPNMAIATSKRKKAFMYSSKARWAITFGRYSKQAVVEHCLGFKQTFQRE